MNNEEKILGLLGQLVEKIDKLETGQAEMRSDIGQINGRLDRLETTQAEMQETLTRVAVTQEGVVLPRLQALYEGHGAIMERLDRTASRDRMDAVEDDVAMMKDSIKLLRMEVNELKKA